MRNLLIDGDNPCAGGRGVLFWNPTTSVTTQLGVDLEGITYESPGANGFFAIDFGGTAVVTRHFQMRRCQLGGTPGTSSTNKGVKLRGCYTVKLNGAYHGGNVALDVDSSVHDFELDHYLILDGANATTAGLTNHTQIAATPIVGGYLLPLKAYYTNNADVASSYMRFPVILLTPQAANPANLSDGMVWTKSTGLFARINGATVGPYT
jgi:hypothetical protein